MIRVDHAIIGLRFANEKKKCSVSIDTLQINHAKKYAFKK